MRNDICEGASADHSPLADGPTGVSILQWEKDLGWAEGEGVMGTLWSDVFTCKIGVLIFRIFV